MRIVLALVVFLLLAGCLRGRGHGGDDGVVDPNPAFEPGPFLSSSAGLDDPLFLTHAGDGSGRLFIVEKAGIIRVVQDGNLLDGPFLDIAAGGPHALVSTSGERGLLGLAFYPDYGQSGRFIVYYTAADGDLTLAQYRNPEPDDNEADPGSGKVLLVVEHSKNSNHNGGMVAFGPDGFLYAGLGDGGASGDPPNNAQDLDTLLGKVIRIDVDGDCTAYCVPADNPFVGRPGRDEVWDYGLRNPWRFSFDRSTGELWIGDVGQNQWEEIDLEQPGDGGNNYGWSRYEGLHDYRQDRPVLTTVAPAREYSHSEGGGDHCAVTGGYVYRGADIPALVGKYVFGDFCSGFVWTLAGAENAMARTHDTDLNISSFGEGEDGELYVVDLGGEIRKLVPAG